jgi:hypothetical protein
MAYRPVVSDFFVRQSVATQESHDQDEARIVMTRVAFVITLVMESS